MTNFRLGCAVWSYKGWVGEVYPSNSRQKDFLRLYGERFTTVEGNTTFYATPSSEIVARWRNETPAGFKFCPKLSKSVTHQGLLQPNITEALQFVQRMQELGDRLGTIFIQLPPHYSPTHLKDLTLFLQALPRKEVSFALEVRHLDWFTPDNHTQLTDLLEELGVATVLLDTRPVYNSPDDPQIASSRRKPKLPLNPVVTANLSFIRFISHPQGEYNFPYLREWQQQIDIWLRQGIQIYFFVHCPIEEHSPHTARDFQKTLQQQGVKIPPLPWDSISLLPEQLTLF